MNELNTETKTVFLETGEKKTLAALQYAVERDLEGPNFEAKISLDYQNQRIRVLDYEGKNLKELVLNLRELAEKNQFDKIIFMAKEDDWESFLTHGYNLEAIIKYYHQGENAYVMSKFRSQERLTSPKQMDETLLIETLMENPPQVNHQSLPEGHEIRLATREEIPALAKLYGRVFESYPTPLGHTEYIEKVFEVSSLFSVVTYEEEIVAAASAEFLSKLKSAEITDCATHPDHRKKGLMTVIVQFLEDELRKRDYICSFSMARAKSYGMNQIFYNLNYQYMGRLINQCDIFGDFEDMNIWAKKLRK